MHLIKEACLFALQQIVIESNDETLKSNIDSIRDMLYNDPDNVFGSISSTKLKQSKMLDESTKWRSLIVEKGVVRQVYSDVTAELLSVVTSKFGDTFKRYMNKLNIELSNIGSYAKHFNDSDERVKNIFKTKLKERLQATQVTK